MCVSLSELGLRVNTFVELVDYVLKCVLCAKVFEIVV